MNNSQSLISLFEGSWKAENQQIDLDPGQYNDCKVFIKREDLIDPVVSGNKFRKLRYNLIQARAGNKRTLLTFGGAYSNHLAAVAKAARLLGMRSIGIVRGEELHDQSNYTLQYCREQGMKLIFISREAYRNRDDNQLLHCYAPDPLNTCLLPEGGTNELAVKGCEEILTENDTSFDYICVAVGTGGTLSGILRSSGPGQKVIGFSALKGSFLADEVKRFSDKPFILTDRYCRGGYGKIDRELVRFINGIKIKYGILLDPVYTGKMLLGLFDMVKTGQIPAGSSVLVIHSGGLQTIEATNKYLAKKNLPQIEQ